MLLSEAVDGKGAGEKTPQDRWVNISINPTTVGDISSNQLEKLVAELKASHYTPLLGLVGVGGPFSQGWASLGDSQETTVFYFKKDSEPMANNVSTIVSRSLSINVFKPQFVNPALMSKDDVRRFIIEHSGLDLQIFLARLQK